MVSMAMALIAIPAIFRGDHFPVIYLSRVCTFGQLACAFASVEG
jgi:hypothetical protein